MSRQGNLPPASPARWREHWPVALVLLLAGVLIFTNLGRDYLWSDEGDTAVLARSILTFGVPTAWDGVTFTDSDFGARLTDDFVMVSSPWLQYYVAAASLAVFGDTALAARLPFALLGLATILIVYLTVWRVARNRWTAASAALLLTLSVQFLIYARQSRHYTLNAALTCLLVFQFSRLNSWRQSLAFALIGILLFHSHPIAVAPLVALGVLTLVYEPFRPQRRWFWRAMPVTALFTVPWFALARGGYEQNTGLIRDASLFMPRVLQFAVEYGSVTSVLGVVALFITLARRRAATPPARSFKRRARPARVPLVPAEERALVVVLFAIIVAYGVLMAVTQPRDVIWTVGMRYTPAVLPFMAMVGALLVARASGHHWRPWVAMLLVLGFTKIGRLTPWTFWQEGTAKRDPSAVVTFHQPERLVDRVFRTGQIAFVQSLFEPSPGTTAQVVEYLGTHANPQDIVVTNYGWEPLYFHTKLPMGMTVLPSYPIYPAVREHALPEYVSGPEGARWIVWRRAWGAYRGQALDRVLAELDAARVPVTLVATIPETLWENRENIHFRRFPGNRYLYPWFGTVPETLIFRVDWPEPKPRGGTPS